MEVEKNNFDDVIEFYKAEETQSLLDQFLNQVEHFFRTNPTLKKAKTIHSIKSRQKDPEHLRDKLMRKYSKGHVITKETLLKEITDLNGVRILHLYQQQFPTIHKEIMKKLLILKIGDWLNLQRHILGRKRVNNFLKIWELRQK